MSSKLGVQVNWIAGLNKLRRFRQSHITRYMVMDWTTQMLLNLTLRRILSNPVIAEEFGVDKEEVLGSSETGVAWASVDMRLPPSRLREGRIKNSFPTSPFMHKDPDSLFVLIQEKRIMDLSPFISSDPAVRCDGWSPERKTRFLDRLAATGNVRAAAARVGMSRDSAYRLRRRDALFARGWAAALAQARKSSVDLLADKATEGIEEEVWYRGELMGTKRRFDGRLLLAHLARLDRMVEELSSEAADDAARFDEILACVGGAQVPEHLEVEDELLPLDRESAIAFAEEDAQDAVQEAWDECRAQKKTRRLTAEERSACENEIEDACARARCEAGVQWDAWFQRACDAVDDRLGRPDTHPLPGLPGNPLTVRPSSPENPDEQRLSFSFPRTVSDVSTSALARVLAGPAPGVALTLRSPFQTARSG